MLFTASPHTHPESPISGSTVESMVDKAISLGRTHFSYTDPGYLTSLYRGYKYATKKGLKFIPGLEVFIKDPNCPYVKGSLAEKSSYFKISLYATNQEQYSFLSELSSKNSGVKITHYGETYSAFGWKEIEEAAKSGLIAVSSDIHDVVAKHILTNTAQIGERILLRLKELFADNYYVSVIGTKTDKSWVSLVHFKLQDGTEDVVLSTSKVSTNAARMAKAIEIVENPKKHSYLKSYQKNYLTTKVGDPGKKITKATIHNGFISFKEGDVQLKANMFMYSLAKKHSINILYSDYAFYSSPEDKAVQDVRLSQEDIKEYTKRHMQNSEEAIEYLKCMDIGENEILKIFKKNEEWASRFDSFAIKTEYRLPEVDNNKTALEVCADHIKSMGRLPNDPRYTERLKYEISVLSKNGKIDLIPYFLPIRDVLDYYRLNNRITGPGRGSSGGSLLLYLMGITQVDPIKYDLSFERFLSLDRVLNGDLPDVDVDLVDREPLVGQDGVSGYLYSRWGNKAAQISTRIQLRLKSSIRDVNRYLHGKVEPEIEKLSKSLPPPPQGISDQDFTFGFEDSDGNHIPGLIETNTDLQKYAESRPKEWELVRRCLGISRQNSKHASAFIISSSNVRQIIPTFMGNTTQFEAKAVEELGLIKYDFLVVNQLKDIELCISYINKKYNKNLSAGFFWKDDIENYIWDLPEEKEVFESIWEGETSTLFQINTQSMIPFVKKIKPNSINDISTILALVRPGPLDFIDPDTGISMADEYVERRNGKGTIKIKEILDLLPETYGVMCIAKNSLVKTSEGLIAIQDVKIGQFVQTEDGSYQRVVNNFYKGIKKTIKVRTDNSEELILTPDHKVLTNRGWVAAGELTNKDLIKHFWASDEKIEDGTDLDWCLGLLLADGNLCTTSPEIACSSEEFAIKVKKIFDKELDLDCTIFKHCRCWYVRLKYKKNIYYSKREPIRLWLENMGVYGTDSYNKSFKKITKKAIEGFIEGDGNLENGTIRIKNEILAKQIFYGLQGLRIKSNYFKDKDEVDVICLDMSSLEFKIKKFNNNIKKMGLRYPKSLFKFKIPRSDDRRQLFYPKMVARIPHISKKVLQRICSDYNIDYPLNQTWSKILRIQEWHTLPVYDLEVDTNHSFVVGGNVVHNCYQEQVSKISKELGGMSATDAENLRRLFSKKQKAKALAMKPIFMENAVKKVDPGTAEAIWQQMETFSRYGFNKSHSTAYAMITYACMYLKHHYPLEWWAAVLSNADEQEITTNLYRYVEELVIPPDINESSEVMTIDYERKKIRAKLSVMKGVGDKIIQPIVENRPYLDLKDFVSKKVAGPSITRKLIHVGVMDSFFKPEMTLLEKMQFYEDTVQMCEYEEKVKLGKKVKEPKKGKIQDEYLSLSPFDDFKVKKSIFPTMPLNLTELVKSYCKFLDEGNGGKIKYTRRDGGDAYPLISGKDLESIEKKLPMDRNFGICVSAYIIKMDEFWYSNDTKKALKLHVDIDGKISERVMWPPYGGIEPEYPKELTKHSIVLLFFKGKQERSSLNLIDIKIIS